jgi:hypothetical protein
MTTHNDQRLPHQEKKESTQQCKHKDNDAADGYHFLPAIFCCGKPCGKAVYHEIIVGLHRFWTVPAYRKRLLNKINYKASDLWHQYVEIVGHENEQYPCCQPVTVFPEIFIDRPEMLHEGQR